MKREKLKTSLVVSLVVCLVLCGIKTYVPVDASENLYLTGNDTQSEESSDADTDADATKDDTDGISDAGDDAGEAADSSGDGQATEDEDGSDAVTPGDQEKPADIEADSDQKVNNEDNADKKTSNGISKARMLAARAAPPPRVTTVDSKADGIVLNMFDYEAEDSWGNNYDSPKFSGINTSDRELQFYGYGTVGTTMNNYTDGCIAMQGIVKNTLQGGYPMINSSKSNSLSYLFDPNVGTNGKTTYRNANYLFQKDSDGYYRYDSNVNYARFNTYTKNFTVYNGTYQTNDNNPIGFFPYNDYNDTKTEVKPNDNYYNHHFGLTMEGNFNIPKDTKVNNKDIVFDFSGDDDVWVFIDDVLVLDIGGIHGRVGGSINFTTGEVKVDAAKKVDTAETSIGTSNTISQIFRDAGRTYDGSEFSNHTIKFFYMERGGCYSNCKLTFNLPVYVPADITVKKVLSGDYKDEYKDKEFSFRAFIETAEGSGQYELYTGNIVNQAGDNVKLGSDGVFKLKGGEQITIPRLNEKLRYYIEEINVDDVAFETKINGIKTENKNGTVTSTKAVAKDRKEITFDNSAKKILSELRLFKTDKNTVGLTDVEFKIYKANINSSGVWSKGDCITPNGVRTDSEGKLTVSLEKGNYLLYETEAKSGYTLPTEPWKITADYKGNLVLKDYKNNTLTPGQDGYYNIVNYAIYSLPATGGSGTYGYTIVGLILLTISVIQVIRIKRREALQTDT